jgi:hypothetical protein
MFIFRLISFKPVYAWVIAFYLMMISASVVFAQTAPGEIRLNYLRVEGVKSSGNHDNVPGTGATDYRWKFKVNGGSWVGNCIGISGSSYTWFYNDSELPKSLRSNIIYDNPGAAVFNLELEAWDEDGCGGECDYNTGITCVDDEARCSGQDHELQLNNYQPGINNSVQLLYCSGGSQYGAQYEFSYTVPVPQTPVIRVNGAAPTTGNICDTNPTIQLTTNSYLNPAFLNTTDFIWQYEVNNNNVWRPLGQTDANSSTAGRYTFTNIRQLDGLTNIASNTDVRFRVISRYNATTGAAYQTISAVTGELHLSPAAPVIGNVVTEPACYGTSTGKIYGAITSGAFTSYKFVLRPGNNTTPCNPDLGNCGGDKSGTIGTWFGLFGIDNVNDGTYTLIITNPAGSAGVCYDTYYPVVVGELPTLQIAVGQITPVSCQGGSDGAISLSASGGKTPYGNYSLTKVGGGYSSSNVTGEFTGLTAGTYSASIIDACNQISPSTTTSVIVTEPVRVSASISPVSPTCNSPADGSVHVNILQGEGEYVYKLSRGTDVVSEQNSSSSTWTVDDLPSGVYTVEIRDAQRVQCDGVIENVELFSAVAFQINEANISRTHVDCYARDNGSIQLNNADIGGDYEYILTAQSDGSSTTQSTSALFSNLAADSYTLRMARTINGCMDSYDVPALVITQPQEAVITLNKQDISCHNETDGSIKSSIAGVTPSDQYIWEMQLGGSWSTLNNSNTFLQNLSAGTYRMRLTNDFSCTATSNSVTIIEPEVLSIASVDARDVVCYSLKGEIETVLQGGVTPYSYEYTSSTAQRVTSTTQITSLDNGIYTLVASDVNGCTVDHTDPLTITAPELPLAMSWVYSDYNGYNISCTGASDGYLDISARGGNGGLYAGYQYTVDDRPFQSSSHVDNISAGAHTIFARDARGCITSAPIMMTSPAANLQPQLLAKKDVKCLGDTDGSVSVSVNGGLTPYTYTLNNVTQPNGTFSSLASGDHTIVISDRNDCKIEYHTTIAILSPPMDVLVQQTDLTCPGGSDGTLQVLVSGGSLPLQYKLDNTPSSSSTITGLSAGSHIVSVIDQQQCLQESIVELTDPEDFLVELNTIPVCVGKTNGEINVRVSGGTPGYQYSISAGASYQDSPHFIVGAGEYEVRIKDNRNCEASASASVITRNDQPEPNFIVATTQHASDTLVIKEISVPKPDSIRWTFDPAITILSEDVWSPLITIREPGSYAISMRGYFGGCDYSNTLTITINPFDPEIKVGKDIPVQVVKSLTATPNSTDGRFEISVELNTKQRLAIAVYDMLGTPHYKQSWSKTSGVTTSVDISSTVSSGVYVVRAVTDTDAKDILLVITK